MEQKVNKPSPANTFHSSPTTYHVPTTHPPPTAHQPLPTTHHPPHWTWLVQGAAWELLDGGLWVVGCGLWWVVGCEWRVAHDNPTTHFS